MTKNNPKPEGQRIKALMTSLESGEIKIPKFQRNYVWKQKDILELLDSLYKGYPIGSLLFWKTHTKVKGERNIGGYELVETKELYPTHYVLDGQQRLTTIYSVFASKENHPGMSEIFDINFDLESDSFVPAKQANPKSIPLHALFDNTAFLETIIPLLSDNPNVVKIASELQETFMNYEVPVVTINNLDIEEVSTIFERINSTGKTLTTFDLMVAATWSESFDLRDAIDELKQELEEKNFGDLSEITILKCLAAVMTENQTKKGIFSLRDQTENIPKGLKRTKQALYKAIDFLTTELSISSSDFLPYDFQIVLLTYFFANVSLPNAEMLTAIRKWFWRSSFAERYQGANDTLLEGDLADFRKVIQSDIPSNIFDFPCDVPTSKILRTEFKKGTAFSNAIIALLASKRPKNLFTGTYVDVANSLSTYNRKEFHHVFPKGFLKSTPSHYSANSVCNIIILSSQQNKKISSKSPSQYFAEIKKTLNDKYKCVLESNLIPSDDVSGIDEDDYNFFMELRAEIIVDHIKQLIE